MAASAVSTLFVFSWTPHLNPNDASIHSFIQLSPASHARVRIMYVKGWEENKYRGLKNTGTHAGIPGKSDHKKVWL